MGDVINTDDAGTFNAEGQLFNANEPISGGTFSYLRQVPDPEATSSAPTPRPLLSSKREEQPRTEVTEEPPPLALTLSGSFSAVRAARTLHQYLVDFWGSDMVTGYVTESDEPDPTADAMDQMYEDFQLFDYLPGAISISRDDFEDLARPQRRTAAAIAALPRVGKREAELVAPTTVDANDEILLPLNQPFSESSLSLCEVGLRDRLGVDPRY